MDFPLVLLEILIYFGIKGSTVKGIEITKCLQSFKVHFFHLTMCYFPLEEDDNVFVFCDEKKKCRGI
jgi:hypothetical protein